MAEGRAHAPARPPRPPEAARRAGRGAAHPLGRLALAGNRAVAALVVQRLTAQRTPGDPPSTATPVLGGTGASGIMYLYHYGDLTTLAEFSSPMGYPRLTDYDMAVTQADAAMYTGAPVSPKLRYKYELRIDQEYFERNFVNTGTRKGYSEYGTATQQKIPTSFFRVVATLTAGPPGGGGGAGPTGGPAGPAGPAGGLPGASGGMPPATGARPTPSRGSPLAAAAGGMALAATLLTGPFAGRLDGHARAQAEAEVARRWTRDLDRALEAEPDVLGVIVEQAFEHPKPDVLMGKTGIDVFRWADVRLVRGRTVTEARAQMGPAAHGPPLEGGMLTICYSWVPPLNVLTDPVSWESSQQ